MHINKYTFLYAFIITVAVVAGCKKDDSSGAAVDDCTPVFITSAVLPDAYIVILNNETSSARVATPYEVRIQSGNLLQRHNISAGNLKTVMNSIDGGFIANLSEEQTRELGNDDEVKIIERDRIFALTEGCITIVKPTSVQWGVRRVGAADGTGKRVWIIDTGVDSDHPDLIVDKILSKCFIDGQTSFEDNHGHGTHVAGIIGAVNNSFGTLGVASGATIIALKALDNDGEGSTTTIIKALNYVGQNAKAGEVVNMSLGADTISNALDNAVRTLAEKGILFSIAAGNSHKLANLCSPARVNNANVYTVSAIDSLGNFATAFSNYGNDVIDYAAPGVRIISTWKDGLYAISNGTSMAAPHVAGILVVKGKVNKKGTAANDPDNVPDPIASY